MNNPEANLEVSNGLYSFLPTQGSGNLTTLRLNLIHQQLYALIIT
jgi:hypothetical protein